MVLHSISIEKVEEAVNQSLSLLDHGRSRLESLSVEIFDARKVAQTEQDHHALSVSLHQLIRTGERLQRAIAEAVAQAEIRYYFEDTFRLGELRNNPSVINFREVFIQWMEEDWNYFEEDERDPESPTQVELKKYVEFIIDKIDNELPHGESSLLLRWIEEAIKEINHL